MGAYEEQAQRLQTITDNAEGCAGRICDAATLAESELGNIQLKDASAQQILAAMQARLNAADDASLIQLLIDQNIDAAVKTKRLIVGDGFGTRVFAAVSGRISKTTSGATGSGDFYGVPTDLGTNADVWVHIPLNRSTYMKVDVSVSNLNAVLLSSTFFIGASDTKISFQLPSTVYASINVDLQSQGGNFDFDGLLGTPQLSLT